MADFAIEFRTWVTSSEWNEPALIARFLEGLNLDLKEEIYVWGSPTQLDQLIELAIRLDKCFEQSRRVRSSYPKPCETLSTAAAPARNQSEAEPMQLGSVHISSEERQRRILNRLCLYCGAAGHFVSSCLLKDRAHQ